MIKITLSLLFLWILSSCGSINIEKRKHTKGFYLSSAKTNQKTEKTIISNLSEGKNKIENSSLAINEEKILFELPIIDSTIKDKSTFCDTIVLRNGAVLAVHILEKTDTTIMYSLCEGDDDSEVIIPRETIKFIKYKEGNFEQLTQNRETYRSKQNKNVTNPKEENLFVFILLSVLGSISLTIIAGLLLILAYVGTTGILLTFLIFLIVALSFYLFLLMIFRNKEKPKFLLLYALVFGIPFGIISYFLFN